MEMSASSKEAKLQGEPYYFTGRPCKRGHIEKRYSSDGVCIACAKQRANGRYQNKKPEILAGMKQQYELNPAKIQERVYQRKLNNPEKVKAEKKAEYERNKPQYIKKAIDWNRANPGRARTFVSNWVKANPDRAYQSVVRRRVKLKQRLPDWLTVEDLREIEQIYQRARQLSEETGILHQVDHIFPIQGRRVSGLHVPLNLQILTAYENRSKSNRHPI